MRYRGGGSGSAPSPVCVEDEWRHTHRRKKKEKTHTHSGDTPLPQQNDQPSGIVHDNTGWHGTWGAGCPQCDPTQGQDASTGFFRCALQSKEQPDSDICQVSVRRFTYWCPTFNRRIAEDTTATHSVCESDHAGVVEIIPLWLQEFRLQALAPEKHWCPLCVFWRLCAESDN